MKGNAAKLLSSITISDSNYEVAKEILKNRYSNPRLISRAHGKSIVNIPRQGTENSKSLNLLIESVEEHRLALSNLGHNVEEQDLFLLYIVVEKLSPVTRQKWEIATPGTDQQTFNQLKTFLHNRCRALEAAESEPGVTKRKKRLRKHRKMIVQHNQEPKFTQQAKKLFVNVVAKSTKFSPVQSSKTYLPPIKQT